MCISQRKCWAASHFRLGTVFALKTVWSAALLFKVRIHSTATSEHKEGPEPCTEHHQLLVCGASLRVTPRELQIAHSCFKVFLKIKKKKNQASKQANHWARERGLVGKQVWQREFNLQCPHEGRTHSHNVLWPPHSCHCTHKISNFFKSQNAYISINYMSYRKP